MAAHKRTGFTIVELLVVITIIGILMALLFPAINIARESARRAQCINNQRQVGLAVITKATSKGDFPLHLANGPTGMNPWPWVIRVLPELGRSDIYDVLQTTPNPASHSQRIDVLICPSDPPVQPNTPQLSYVGNTGKDGLNEAIANGLFFQSNKVSLSYVAKNDGVSTTLMLSENIDAVNWTSNGTGADQVFQTALIWQDTAPATDLNKMAGTGGATKDYARPSSRHSGGFVVTFCDESTRFLSQEIGYNVYQLIMTPNGKAATPPQATPLSDAQLNK